MIKISIIDTINNSWHLNMILVEDVINPNNPQFTTSVDCKLVTGKDESISSETIKNEDTTEIMDELAVM